MASIDNLDYSIETVIKYYSSLFTLPSYTRIMLFTFLMCGLGSILLVFLHAHISFVLVFQFALMLFLLSTIADFLISKIILNSDLVYNTRRCSALSMFSILLMFGIISVGALLTRVVSRSFWGDSFSIAFASACIFRSLVLFSTSSTTRWRTTAASLLQPLICLLPIFHISFSVGYAFSSATTIYILLSFPIAILTATIFTKSVDSVGLESIEISTTTVLKAFLAHWMENLNAPIERLFENFGKEKTIAFSLLGIKTEAHLKSVLVVSSFHPGPFSSVGSSLLPFMLQKAIEEKTGCVVSVPHGLYGHEFDLPSQKENRKVLKGVLNSTDFANFTSKATKFVCDQKSAASASCQIFGDSAILTLTLSPKTTEDFPQELGDFICKKATQLGLKHVMIINAHNSINGPFDVKSAVESLKMVASAVLHKASRLTPSSFKVGVARVVPREFSLEDGMGYGGICAIVVKVEDQTCVYITIDGNNMITGLRERILRSLKELGVNAGEVLTTDTHAVNAIVMTKRGYHPIGEAIPHAKLISYIKTAVQKALNSMEPASSAWRTGEVPGVKVIGERQIEKMALLAERSLRRAKRTAIPLFASVGLLLIGLLAIL